MMHVHGVVQDAPSSMVAGVSVIKMSYLDAADGWISLRSYTGDWEQLQELANTSLAGLHDCLDSSAVHGDLSADNVFIRYDLAKLQHPHALAALRGPLPGDTRWLPSLAATW